MKKGILINDGKEILIVTGILHKIGNQKPYFSITCEIWKYSAKLRSKVGRDCLVCGCLHDEILKYFPNLADFVALHLSYNDGVPMHAVENGWYWNGGSKHQEYNRENLANHLRVTPEQADTIHADCNTKEKFAELVDSMRERWRAEADAVIKKYNLNRIIED